MLKCIRKYGVILLVGSAALADTHEIVMTSVSYHPMISDVIAAKLDGKLSRGLNFTPIIGFAQTETDFIMYTSYKAFFGRNCVSQPMVGAMVSSGADLGGFQLGLVGGAYYQDSSEFTKRGVSIPVGDIMPILGIEMNYRVYIDDQAFLKITNTLSPVLTNHALSIGWDL